VREISAPVAGELLLTMIEADGVTLRTYRLPQEPLERRSLRGAQGLPSPAAEPTVPGDDRPYSPWPSLRPTAWAPIVQIADGAIAFGAVVYEMATGRKAFDGTTPASIIAAILEREPQPIAELQPLATPPLERVVQRCLVKDREHRWQTARDLELELKWMSGGGSQAGFAAAPIGEVSSRLWKAWTVASVLGVATIALGVVLGWKTFHSTSPARDMPVVRFDIPLTTADSSAFSFLTLDRGVAIAPDGSRVVFRVPGVSASRLFLRNINAPGILVLPGTEGAFYPFFSPDGQSIAFFAAGKLKAMALSGGRLLLFAMRQICKAAEPGGRTEIFIFQLERRRDSWYECRRTAERQRKSERG